jgi:hypothetical protein
MAAPRLSPTANLLRKSRLFSLPPALTPPQGSATSRTIFESGTATLPHPVRAAIETPASSLARGDWGLKRPLPAKSTTDKSSRPVVRVNALDTFEHVTDFESAADHTVTLQKFQELHLPMSLPAKISYATSMTPRHQSPFDTVVDNTEKSEGLKRLGAKQFRHSGPWVAGQSELEFQAYLERIRRRKPELLQKLRERYIAKRTAERRKQAQDKGEDLQGLDQPVEVTEEEFQAYVKSLRGDKEAMATVVFELLDLPSPPAVPNDRIASPYFQPPPTKLSAPEYAISGPPKTHPSAGLSYARSHAMLYNHPSYGPQAHPRPVEARILLPKKRYKGRMSRAIVGVGGIASEDLNAIGTFAEQTGPPGLAYFDASIPGGAKYWVTPVRVSVDSDGRIGLFSYRASVTARAPYGITDYKKPSSTSISEVARGEQRTVPRLDRHPSQPRFNDPDNAAFATQPARGTEDVARSLMRTISS